MNLNETFARQVFSLSPSILKEAYSSYLKKDRVKIDIIKDLAEFKRLRDYQPESVAIDKLITPPGGNVHDYYSQAPYWFPDPASATGLPYIRKDGEFNPEAVAESSDHKKMNRMISNLYAFSILFFFTRNEATAAKAATLLRHWFLNSETAMNPHLNFGQAIPGINTGRDAGIIETHIFIQVIDAMIMLTGSQHWTASDNDGMKRWMNSYLEWLRHSKIGRDENKAQNNHGIWYIALAMKLAAFCGHKGMVEEYIEQAKGRITIQICQDGSMPEELKRTQSWGYSIFGLSAFLAAATIAGEYGEDLFNHKTEDGKGIRGGVDFLAEFASGRKTWTFPELHAFAPEKLTPALHIAAMHYCDDKYLRIQKAIPAYDDMSNVLFFK
jgi:hypothetical protein